MGCQQDVVAAGRRLHVSHQTIHMPGALAFAAVDAQVDKRHFMGAMQHCSMHVNALVPKLLL
jgi:hypothetical protein